MVLCRAELQSKLREFSDRLLSDEALAEGAWAMMKTFERLQRNPSELLLALHTFGRRDAAPLRPRRAAAGGPRKVTLEVGGRLNDKVASCSDHHYSNPVGGAKCGGSVEACHSEPES